MDRDPRQHVSDLVKLCKEKLHAVGTACPRENALQILRTYASSLDLAPQDAAEIFCDLSRRDLQFEIPVTFMHGDLSIRNAGYDTRTRLIDWEWACPNGSVLYDWWYLRNWVSWQISLGNLDGSLSGPVENFVALALPSLGVAESQFNQFGRGMHAIYLVAKQKVKHNVPATAIRRGIDLFRKSLQL
jgi:hypothetical protein